MTNTNTMIAKIAAITAGLGLAAMSFMVMPAQAQTTTSNSALMAQIAALQAQIASLQAQIGGGASATIYTRDLTIGSTGSDVVALQTWLISKGFSIPAGATGYFGLQTRAALAAFQAANGITPTAGYFGPITRARVIAMIGTGGSTSGGGTTSGALQGGSGQLSNVDMLGDVESDLQEGDAATKVLGFEAEAKDSDLAVQRVDVNFTISGNTGSSNLDKYVDSVSLYQDGKKLATMDASSGDKDGRTWSFRFSDVNGIIREGDTSNFYVEVTPVTSVGGDESGVNLTATIPSDGVRAVDAEGISETYTPSGTRTQTFTVSTATRGTFSLSEATDNPDNSVVKGDTNDSTDDVTLLAFNARARNQDITLNDLPVGFHVTGTSNVGDVVQSVKLMRGNTTVDTATVSGSGSYAEVLFNNLDENIDSGNSEEYTVVATIRKMGTGSSGTAFDAGDTLIATTSSSSNTWDVEDSNGDQVNPTGSVTGGTITFQTTGITVAKTDASYNKTVGQNTGEGDKTQYSISFKVTAGDDDLYIDRSIQRTTNPTTAGGGIAWATTTSSGSNVTDLGVSNISASDTNNADTATSFKIPSGTTRTFTLNVTLTATATGFTGVQLTGINYDTDANTNDSTLYYTAGLDTFKTADVSMSLH